MSQGWVLLWLAAAPATGTQQEHLRKWAARNDIVLTAPAADVGSRPTAYQGETVAHIETLLERARLAVDGLDAVAALKLIGQVRQALGEHPELPQAPWLLAETFHIEADLARAEGDAQRAEALELKARRLEGPRSRAAPQASSEANLETTATPPPARQWMVSGPRPDDQLVWNGARVEPPARGSAWHVETIAGLQHVRVLRGGVLLWAGWIEVSDENATVELQVPAPAPCSAEDLAPMHVPGLVGVPVSCDRWIAARPVRSGPSTAPETIEVARCHRDQCGAFERWPPPRPLPAAPLAPERDSNLLTGAPWWTYAAIGTVVATTATILLLGVTQRRDEERPVWVYGGIR